MCVTRDSLVRDAGLTGWGDSHHPALTNIGENNRFYEPTVSLELIETLLTQSQALKSAGWKFTALRNHQQIDEYPGTDKRGYILRGPPQTNLELPEMETATAQSELGDENDAVVSFDPKIAEGFSSIRLLLPGDPLFDKLVSIAQTGDDEVVFVCGYRRKEGANQIKTKSSYDATDDADADVVLPAISNDNRSNLSLPESGSVYTHTEAKKMINKWLSAE